MYKLPDKSSRKIYHGGGEGIALLLAHLCVPASSLVQEASPSVCDWHIDTDIGIIT